MENTTRVIGFTKSGKVIYNTYSHIGHSNYTRLDHLDAAASNKAISERITGPSIHNGETITPEQQTIMTQANLAYKSHKGGE